MAEEEETRCELCTRASEEGVPCEECGLLLCPECAPAHECLEED